MKCISCGKEIEDKGHQRDPRAEKKLCRECALKFTEGINPQKEDSGGVKAFGSKEDIDPKYLEENVRSWNPQTKTGEKITSDGEE